MSQTAERGLGLDLFVRRPPAVPVFGTSSRNEDFFRGFRDFFGDDDDDDRPARGHGREGGPRRHAPQITYRTVCVRMCDGYYFPISYATTRERFARDAQACQSRCGSEARLFVFRSADGSPESMEDVQGRPYSQLPNAFLYRSQYVESCKCQPDPWDAVSNELHRRYALMEAAKKGDASAQAELKALEKKMIEQQAKTATTDASKLPESLLPGTAPPPVLSAERPMVRRTPFRSPSPPPATTRSGLPEWARRVFENY